MAFFLSDSLQSLVVGLLGLTCLGFLVQRLYSVYFGPLSKFPGPKMAAFTMWYEFYYDVILKGRYTFKIMEMHEKYGPIIRISPYELHVDEPNYYEELYSQTKPRNKSQFYANQFAIPGAGFGTIDHKLHRARRSAMNPFLSKQTIANLQPMLTFMIEKLCKRIEEFKESSQPMPMRAVYMCLTTDVVTLCALNRSWNHLDSPDFSPLWVETIKAVAASGHIMKHFPFLSPTIKALPRRVVKAMDPGMLILLEFQDKIQENTQNVIDGVYKQDEEFRHLGLEKTVFHALLESDLPPEEKLQSRMWQEGQVVIGAGSDTTAHALTTTHFHILDNPDVHKKLVAELEEALPSKYDPILLKTVERLPYLNAVINEGLRFSYGVSTRLQRAHPTEVMTFHDYEIPPNTPVGMTSVLMHNNATIFPEPTKFLPSRWLDPRPVDAPPLDRYLVPFSKGSRNCVGMHLAKAELRLTLAMVFRRFGMDQKLFETTRKDVDIQHDLFLPQPVEGSKGVRVIFG